MTNMQRTGRNFLQAVGIACLVGGLLGLLYAILIFVVETFVDAEPYSVGESLQRTFFFFRTVFLFSAPVVFIIAFAVLQRLRSAK